MRKTLDRSCVFCPAGFCVCFVLFCFCFILFCYCIVFVVCLFFIIVNRTCAIHTHPLSYKFSPRELSAKTFNSVLNTFKLYQIASFYFYLANIEIAQTVVNW